MANVTTITNTKGTITSLEVAIMVEKEHNQLLKDIRRYIKQLGQGNIPHSDFFTESTYVNSQNKEQPCFNVTRKGCEFIANKLTGQKGTEFTARYVNRFHELEENNVSILLIKSLDSITERLNSIENKVNEPPKKLPIKQYSRWKSRTFDKLNMLLSYVNENSTENLSLSDVLHIVTNEFLDTYNIDLNEYTDMYKCEYGIDHKPYDLDVINHYKDIRKQYDLTLENIMKRLNIDLVYNNTPKNIFDVLASQINQTNNPIDSKTNVTSIYTIP